MKFAYFFFKMGLFDKMKEKYQFLFPLEPVHTRQDDKEISTLHAY
jgi:hypothetical protein